MEPLLYITAVCFRGQFGTVPRFPRRVEPAPAFGAIFPFARSINLCSEPSLSVDPYQV